MINYRDNVERRLLKEQHIRPLTPREFSLVDGYKDGSFGLSNMAFSLYSNGNSERGKSDYPFGLIYEDGESIFSIGHFAKRENTRGPGYLFITSPKGERVIDKAREVSDIILRDTPSEGVYVRFLDREKRDELFRHGFLPSTKMPYAHPAHAEDETYPGRIVNIAQALEILSKSSEKLERTLKRDGAIYKLHETDKNTLTRGRSVISEHFEMLRDLGKSYGSSPEDHLNSLDPDLLAHSTVISYWGELNGKEVSFFAGEELSPKRVGLYTPFTLRHDRIATDNNLQRRVVQRLPRHAQFRLFQGLAKKGYEEAHYGGSEGRKLDGYKAKLGGRADTTHWAAKARGNT